MRWYRDAILLGLMTLIAATLAYVLTRGAEPQEASRPAIAAPAATASAQAGDSPAPASSVLAVVVPTATAEPESSLAAPQSTLTESAGMGDATRTPMAKPISATPAAAATPGAASSMPMDSAPSASATAQDVSPAALLQKVADKESALQVGYLEATLRYPSGEQSRSEVSFDIRDSARGPRWHSATTYTGQKGQSTSELVSVGNQAWQRQGDGAWTTTREDEPPSGRLLTYLPDLGEAENPQVQTSGAGQSVLKWHDPIRDGDVELQVSPSTGIPVQYTLTSRRNQSVLTVSYLGWNSAITIDPPVS